MSSQTRLFLLVYSPSQSDYIRPIFKFNNDLSFGKNFESQVFDLTNLDEAKGKLDKIKSTITQIQTSKELTTNTDKQNAFADYAKGIDNEAIRKTAKDFDILNGSVDDFANNALTNLYASELKCTTGFVGVNSVIKTFNANSDKSTTIAKAVGQSNQKLGAYLTKVAEQGNGASASITGYGLSLVKMTGKAVLAKTAQALIPTKKHSPIPFIV